MATGISQRNRYKLLKKTPTTLLRMGDFDDSLLIVTGEKSLVPKELEVLDQAGLDEEE